MYHTHSETSTLERNLHYMHVSNYAWAKPGLCELAVESKRSHTEIFFFFLKRRKIKQMKETW